MPTVSAGKTEPMLVRRAGRRTNELGGRLLSDGPTVLKAMGTAKAEPLSLIGRGLGRSGIEIEPCLELKSCLNPKRSRITRTEYSTALHSGMRSTLGIS